MGDEDICQVPGCGLPRSAHEYDEDPAVLEREEFEREVAHHVEQKLAEHHYFQALVAWKMAQARGDRSVPKPRSPAVDAAELALIEARELNRVVGDRVAQKMQRAHVRAGTAKFVKDEQAPTRAEWLKGVGSGKSADFIETKDA